MKATNYPTEIIKIAEQYIFAKNKNVKTIIPIYNRGFIAVIEVNKETIFRPYIQIGSYAKDFISVNSAISSFYNYDEAIIAMLTFRNLGEGFHPLTYLDVYCNKMGVTRHSNSVNPIF